MKINGRSLELYFVDGKPDGMLTAEVFNWTGHILMTPRTQLKEALQRQEASYTGVYILLGEIDSLPTLYIGEAEDISERIRNHDSKKDWWDTAIFVTSSANNLHKAHVKYLEARLVETARQIGRIKLDNGNSPQRSSLPEAAATNMEAFLDYLLMVLPALRIDIFLDKTSPTEKNLATSATETSKPVFVLESKKHDLSAIAILDGSDFIVQAGSTSQLNWSRQQTQGGYKKLFEELYESGVLLIEGNKKVFTKNYAFSSTSAAAAIVLGRASRGPTEWKLKSDGRTYQEWEDDQLSQDKAD